MPDPVLNGAKYGRVFAYDSADTLYCITTSGMQEFDTQTQTWSNASPGGTAPSTVLGELHNWTEMEGEGTDTFTIYTSLGKVVYYNHEHSTTPNEWGTETVYTAPLSGYERYGMTRLLNGVEVRLFNGSEGGSGQGAYAQVDISFDNGTATTLSENDTGNDHRPIAIAYQDDGTDEWLHIVYMEDVWVNNTNASSLKFRTYTWTGSSWGTVSASSAPVTSQSSTGVEASHYGASAYVDSSAPTAGQAYDEVRILFREGTGGNYMYSKLAQTGDNNQTWATSITTMDIGTADNNGALAAIIDESVVAGVHNSHALFTDRSASSGRTVYGNQSPTEYYYDEELFDYPWIDFGGLGGYTQWYHTGNVCYMQNGNIIFNMALGDYYDRHLQRVIYAEPGIVHNADLLVFIDEPRERVHGADMLLGESIINETYFAENSFYTGSSISATQGHYVFGHVDNAIKLNTFFFRAIEAGNYTVEIGLGSQWNQIDEVLGIETKALAANESAPFLEGQDFAIPVSSSENWYYKISSNLSNWTLYYNGSNSVTDGLVTLDHWWSDSGANNDSWTPGQVWFEYSYADSSDQVTNSFGTVPTPTTSSYRTNFQLHWNTNDTIYRVGPDTSTTVTVHKSTDDAQSWSLVKTITVPADRNIYHGFQSFLVDDGGTLGGVGSSIDGSHIQILITWRDYDEGPYGHDLMGVTSTILQTDDCVAGTDSTVEENVQIFESQGGFVEHQWEDVHVFPSGVVGGFASGMSTGNFYEGRARMFSRGPGASATFNDEGNMFGMSASPQQDYTPLYIGVHTNTTSSPRPYYKTMRQLSTDLVMVGATAQDQGSSGTSTAWAATNAGFRIGGYLDNGTDIQETFDSVYTVVSTDSKYHKYTVPGLLSYSLILYVPMWIAEFEVATQANDSPANETPWIYKFMIFNKSGNGLDSGFYVTTKFFLDRSDNLYGTWTGGSAHAVEDEVYLLYHPYNIDPNGTNSGRVRMLYTNEAASFVEWSYRRLPDFYGTTGSFGSHSIALFRATHDRMAAVTAEYEGVSEVDRKLYYFPIHGQQHHATVELYKELPIHSADLTLQGAVRRTHQADMWVVARLDHDHDADVLPVIRLSESHSADVLPVNALNHTMVVITAGGTQQAQPDADGEYDAGWIAAPDRGAPLWNQVNEDPYDDSDYVWYLAPQLKRHNVDLLLPISRIRDHSLSVTPAVRNYLAHLYDIDPYGFYDDFSTDTLSNYTVTGVAATWNASGWIDVSTGDNNTTEFTRSDLQIGNVGYAEIDWTYGGEWDFGDRYSFYVYEDANNYIRMDVADSYYGNNFIRYSGGVEVENVDLSAGTTEPPSSGSFTMTFEWGPDGVEFGIQGGTLATHTPTGWIGPADYWTFQLSQLAGDWNQLYLGRMINALDISHTADMFVEITAPDDLSSMDWWWNSADLSLTADDPVSTWSDSTSTYSLTQATGSKQPIYRTNVKNGEPAVEFDSANSQILYSTTPALPYPNTIFLVGRSIASGAGYVTFDGNTARQTFGSSGASNSDTGLWAAGSTVMLVPSINTTWDWSIWTLVSNDTSSIVRRDGSQVVANGDSIGTTGLDDLVLGGRYTDERYFDGYIGEIIAYDQILSDEEIEALESILSTKWDIPLA